MTEETTPNLGSEEQETGVAPERDDPGAAPEAEGLPAYADDEAPANRRVDDPQRLAVPGDSPLAVEDFGTTGAEERRGEPLAGRLAREEPDVGVADPGEQSYEPGLRTEVTGSDEVAGLDGDADLVGDPGREDPALEATFEGDDPRTDSPVSIYDRMDRAAATGGPVGELVAPDEGAHPDRERFAVAREADRVPDGPESDAVRDEGPGR